MSFTTNNDAFATLTANEKRNETSSFMCAFIFVRKTAEFAKIHANRTLVLSALLLSLSLHLNTLSREQIRLSNK